MIVSRIKRSVYVIISTRAHFKEQDSSSRAVQLIRVFHN